MKVRLSVCVWPAGWSVTELRGGQNSGICMQSSGSWPVTSEESPCTSLSLALSNVSFSSHMLHTLEHIVRWILTQPTLSASCFTYPLSCLHRVKVHRHRKPACGMWREEEEKQQHQTSVQKSNVTHPFISLTKTAAPIMTVVLLKAKGKMKWGSYRLLWRKWT